MKLYTEDEIIDDIYQFEGLIVKLNLEYENCKFIKLYSEYYNKKASGTMNVDEFKNKVNEFILKHLVVIDNLPSGKNRYTIYSENEVYLNKLDEFNDQREFNTFVEKYMNEFKRLVIYDNKEDRFDLVLKNLH